MKEVIFSLSDVHYSYLGKYPALCSVDLEILKGEKITVIGANGTGKSTLLQILDGLIFPDKGSVTAFGKQLNEDVFEKIEFSRFFRSNVGFVFQNSDVQLFCPTVKEDIAFGPLQLGVEKQEIEGRLKRLAKVFNIEGLMERPIHHLSIGEKRKVAIATTLAIEPEVLLLDEPTAGLDPQTVRHIVDILVEANLNGTTIITATHDLHLVEEISDKVYVLNAQKTIARFGPPDELLADAEFLKNNNLVHIHKHRHKGQIHVHDHCHYHTDHH
ncbi:MAG: ABC transporter ATP-binding protein [Candidatus Firestonebacteria bacterium]